MHDDAAVISDAPSTRSGMIGMCGISGMTEDLDPQTDPETSLHNQWNLRLRSAPIGFPSPTLGNPILYALPYASYITVFVICM